jgi:DNA-binding NarL/FixJ family response regulator
MVQQFQPDVMVLDINMPRLEGIEATKRISDLQLRSQVLILSMYSDEALVKKALKNGARGYLLKRSVSEELITAVRAVSRREIYISPAIEKTVVTDLLNSTADTGKLDPINLLTPREREVFKLIAEGYTNNAIALELDISVKTVEKHRAKLMEKLGVSDLVGLVRAAIKHRVIFIEEWDRR